MSVQFYRRFSENRKDRNGQLELRAEFVRPSSFSFENRYINTDIEFTTHLIRIFTPKQNNTTFVVKDNVYLLNPETLRFKIQRRYVFKDIKEIHQNYKYLFNEKAFDKLVKAGFIIPLARAEDREDMYKTLKELKVCAAVALL